MKKLVVLTGAGISAESGIKTFRDAGGLWEGYNVMEVASPQGWENNPELVLAFYNERRKNVRAAEPNNGHKALVQLEQKYEVTIITQNIDDLHERAGSKNIIHLHGEILKARSSINEELVYDLGNNDILWGQKCEDGSQMRPHIVWYGEAVPLIEPAMDLAAEADIMLIIGTSLEVYPAAGLIHFVRRDAPIYLIDPKQPRANNLPNLTVYQEQAGIGVPKLVQKLLNDA